jgi:formate dehydrogenase alpha subunit
VVADGCITCPKNGSCELKQVAEYIDIKEVTLPYTYRELPIHKEPFFDRDYNLCILCGRCVRICQEVRGVGAISFTYRGSQAIIGTAFDRPLKESGCEFCGACVDACPTAALMEQANRWAGPAEREVVTTCPYCGVGCQLKLEIKDDRILRVRAERDNAVNQGQLCVKGRFGMDFVHAPHRLTKPLIKRDGEFMEASWEEALELVAQRLGSHKGGEFAAISSAKCTNEENYLIQKFARAVMGTNNVDHCARLCHASTVAGLALAFGSGAMTNSIREIRDAACILAIGTNTTENHPVIGLEIKKAVRNGAKLIVANPREIELCRFAHLWLRQRPGTDVALLMGMARVIVAEGLADKNFIEERCENFAAFRESLKGFDLDWVSQVTGVTAPDIAEAARIYATNHPASILFAMGITQHSHGTDNVLATANLAMLTGNVGRLSSGVNPLRGQNNVQGACDMGALPNVYPGYQSVTDPAIGEKFEAAWGCALPQEPGLTLTEVFDAAYQGRIKALYLVGENPFLSDPDAEHVREALKRLEFLVVQDIFLSETAKLAHVVLPAASFAEKDGTFTNTERRVQRVRQAISPIGDSRPDWWITCQIAKRLDGKGFDFDHPSEVMAEISRLTPSYGGISYERLNNGGLQWPCPSEEHPGTSFLHKEAFTRGRGYFAPLEYKPSQEQPDGEYPLLLTTGRSLFQFHTGTMTRKVSGLNIIKDEEQVEMNPDDAAALGIAEGEEVLVISRRGRVEAKLKVTEDSPPGVVFMTFHFAESPTNLLTNPALDPVAKIPELKVCAVRVVKVG